MPPTVELAQLEELKKSLLDALQAPWQKRETDLAERLTKEFEDRLNAHLKRLSLAWPTMSVPGTEPTGDAKKDFNVGRAAYAIATKDWSKAGVEAEVFAATRKTMSTGVDTQGGFLVPPQALTQIIEPLRSSVVCMKLGARDMAGFPFAPISIPRQTADVAAQWVAENGQSTLSDLRIEQMNMRPRQLIARTQITKMLLNAAVPSVDGLITTSAQEQFRRAIDKAMLVGAGNSAEPSGVANTQGTQLGTLDLSTSAFDRIVDFVGLIRSADALAGRLGWAMSPAFFHAVQKIKDPTDNSQPLERRMLASGPIDTLLGYPFETTSQLTPYTGANKAFFGNFASLFLLRFGGIELLASDTSDTAMATNSVQIRLVMYADIGIEQPKAFAAASA